MSHQLGVAVLLVPDQMLPVFSSGLARNAVLMEQVVLGQGVHCMSRDRFRVDRVFCRAHPQLLALSVPGVSLIRKSR